MAKDSAYFRCQWCHGKGCLACAGERAKDKKQLSEPLFVASTESEHDMELLKNFFGKEAIDKAFKDERGNGMQDILVNAVIARLLQTMHKEDKNA
jgi:hypothetical protein